MQIQNDPASTNFQAKLIIGDEKIQKFIKSSFMTKSKETFETLDKFSEIYPDSIVSLGIKSTNNRDYLVAKNGITGAIEKKFLHNTDIVKLEDNTAFIDLIKKVMKNKVFWTEKTEDFKVFDNTSVEPKIEHVVFKLDK